MVVCAASVGPPHGRTGRRYEGHEAFAEEGGGQHLGGDPGRDLPELSGGDGQHQTGARAVGVDGLHPADDDSAHLHIGARTHLVADAAGLHGDGRLVGERLVVDGDREPGQQTGHQQEDQARGPAAGGGGAPGAAERGRRGGGAGVGGGHPATRTVVVAPQMARLRKKSVTEMITMALRTERPTAMPTLGRAALGGVAVVAVREDHHDAEDQYLQGGQQDVGRGEEEREVVVVGPGGLAVERDGDQPGGGVTADQADAVERDDRHDARDDPGGDQVRHAADAHAFERVDLLVDPHRAELGGEAGADGRGQGEARHQGGDLPGVEVGGDEAGEGGGAEFVHGRVALEADDRAGGQCHADHHADRAADDAEAAAAERDLGQQALYLLEVAAQGARDPQHGGDVEEEVVTCLVEPSQPTAAAAARLGRGRRGFGPGRVLVEEGHQAPFRGTSCR